MFHQDFQSFPTRTKEIELSDFHMGQIAIALMMAFSLFVGSFLLHQQAVQAKALLSYSCLNNPEYSSGHCYGVQFLPGGGAKTGVFSEIFVRGVTGGNGEITNEIWFVQGSYWVEAGYWANVGWNNGSETWFWADIRPGESNINVRPSSPLISGDGGHYAAVEIEQNSSCTFNIYISGFSSGMSGTSSHNCINPNEIIIGEELAGTNGASGPTADFTANEFRGHIPSDPWAFISSIPAPPNADDPPTVRWVVAPNSSNGGTLATCTGC